MTYSQTFQYEKSLILKSFKAMRVFTKYFVFPITVSFSQCFTVSLNLFSHSHRLLTEWHVLNLYVWIFWWTRGLQDSISLYGIACFFTNTESCWSTEFQIKHVFSLYCNQGPESIWTHLQKIKCKNWCSSLILNGVNS